MSNLFRCMPAVVVSSIVEKIIRFIVQQTAVLALDGIFEFIAAKLIIVLRVVVSEEARMKDG